MSANGEWGVARRSAHADRLAAERIAAVFGTVTLGVLGAGAAAVVLAAALVHLGILAPRIGLDWAGYIVACAGAHIMLHRVYRRKRPCAAGWRPWAAAFTAICLAEGLGWGWASVRLAAGSGFETELLVLIVTLAVAAGAIPAFSPYLPAFLALFVPVTVPYALQSAVSPCCWSRRAPG